MLLCSSVSHSNTQPQRPPRFVHDHLIVGNVYYLAGILQVCAPIHWHTITLPCVESENRCGTPFHQTES